jgi:hypothetical protein
MKNEHPKTDSREAAITAIILIVAVLMMSTADSWFS